MRTIRSMRKRLKGRIYIRCGTLEIHKQFIQDAEAAGYLIGGRKPTEAEMPWDIILLDNGKGLRYCGYVDHIAFKTDSNAYRVDYGKYSGGVDDYLWHENPNETASFVSHYHGKCIISGRRADEALGYYLRQTAYYDTAREERMLFAEMEHVFKVLVIAERKSDNIEDIQLLS